MSGCRLFLCVVVNILMAFLSDFCSAKQQIRNICGIL
jgi:hypothetical protein